MAGGRIGRGSIEDSPTMAPSLASALCGFQNAALSPNALSKFLRSSFHSFLNKSNEYLCVLCALQNALVSSLKMEGNGHSCSYSATSIRNGLISGYTAGICGIVIGHPLDSLKVLLQTANARPDNPSSGSAGRVGANVNSSIFVISRASSTATAAAVSSQPSRVPTSN